MTTATRTLSRLAWRTARHHPGRTAMVAVLVGLAVAVGVAAGVLTRSTQPTTAERDRQILGGADLLVLSPNPLSTTPPLHARPALPASRVAERWTGAVDPVGAYPVDAVAADHHSSIVAPSVRVEAGRLPTAVGEVALSAGLADHLGLGPGDQLVLQGGDSLAIVGTTLDPLAIDDRKVHLYLHDHGLLDIARPGWLVDLPGSPSADGLRALASDLLAADPGLELRLRGGEQVPDLRFSTSNILDRPAVVSALVAAAILVEVALIAAAAHAAGIRRRLHELGLLTANGASPAHLRRLVTIEAGLSGILGAALGVGLALVGLWAARPLLQELSARELGYRWVPIDVAVPVALGVLAATVAAWLPGRTASRVPVRAALAGRTPSGPVPSWMTPAGVLGATTGLLILAATASTPRADTVEVFAGLTGAVLTLLGGALLTPGLLALVARLGSRLPHQLRLVARDSARQRTRAATAVAALIAVLMVPVMLTTILHSEEAAREARHDPSLPADMALVNAYDDQGSPVLVAASTVDEMVEAAGIDHAAEVLVGAPASPPSGPTPVWVSATTASTDRHGFDAGTLALATPELVEALDLDAEAVARAVDAGLVIAVGDRKPAEVAIIADGGDEPVELGFFETVRLRPELTGWAVPDYLAGEAVFEQLGLAPIAGPVLLRAPAPLDPAERRALELVAVDQPSLSVTIEPGPASVDATPASVIALGLALVVTLAVIGATTALSATESDADMTTVVAVGAEPRFRRRFLAVQAGYHALAAAVIAVPLALLAVHAVHRPGSWEPAGVVVPWTALGVVVLAIPVIAAVATGLAVRPAPTMSVRRPT